MTRIDMICGFLGAGKTTFIKQYAKWLKQSNQPFVVIENEFGAAGVDTAILKNEDIAVSELAGGCICCSQKVNFHNTILELAKEYDRIIVEPSGIFDIDDFFDIIRSPQIKDVCTLGLILTIVDPKMLEKLDEIESAMLALQLHSTSKLILSKTDTLLAQQISQSIATIQQLSQTHFCSSLKDNLFETRPWNQLDDCFFSQLQNAEISQTAHIRRTTDHANLFASTTLYPTVCFTFDEIYTILTTITDGTVGNILRIKGYVDAADGGSFQINCTGSDLLIENTKRYTPMLNLIGKNLKRFEIKKLLSNSQ